ncbi:9999_t:CDS:2, partial [Paraglomus brasilianum]
GTKPDYKRVKSWQKKDESLVHIHSPMFMNGGNVNSLVGSSSGVVFIGSQKVKLSVPIKQKRSFDMAASLSSTSQTAEGTTMANSQTLKTCKNDDLANSDMLQHVPTVCWKVRTIDVTTRFWQYQRNVLEKAKKGSLSYKDTYELLALSSIIILEMNSYVITEQPLPPEISYSLYNTCHEFVLGKDVFMEGGKSKLSRTIAHSFNELCNSVPAVSSLKMTEDQHCYQLLHLLTCPLFLGPQKDYELQLNCAVKGSKQRPDFACVVDDTRTPILISEIKPQKCTPLLQSKDRLRVHFWGQKAINQQLQTKGGPGDLVESFFMDLKYDGIYCSWPFLMTKLVVDKCTIPLAELTISHFVALEKRVGKIAEDYKCRTDNFTPPQQIIFICDLPDSLQMKILLQQ